MADQKEIDTILKAMIRRKRKKWFWPFFAFTLFCYWFSIIQTNFFPSSTIYGDQLYMPSYDGSVARFTIKHSIHSLLYAVVFGWALAYVFAMIRCDKFAQCLKNNRCLKCDYNLKASGDQCPECGAVQSELYDQV